VVGERYLRYRGIDRLREDVTALAFIRRNLGVLKQARGDRQGAAELYQAVLDQLRNADPEFATLLAEVKRRLSEVTRES
jgi:hypothetical protein